MYGRFLKEAAVIADDERLNGVSEEMQAIGDEWQSVAETLEEAHRATNSSRLISEASRRVLDIAEREQTTWQQLSHIAASSRRGKI